mmetsp:Transcript_68956/g.165482  ORF Transcript_68956/g.165482 Transcript_68956/m.165482 type:complete len:171 (-) Transcript_68956:111-623(-)
MATLSTTLPEGVGTDFVGGVHKLLGVSEEEYNSKPGYREVHEYLVRHRIQQLFNGLLARAALERPPDLRVYVIEVLTEMKKNPTTPSVGFFTDEDVETMFDMWDVGKLGTLLPLQVAETLKALGSSQDVEEVSQKLVDDGITEVDKATFTRIVRSELGSLFSPLAVQGDA